MTTIVLKENLTKCFRWPMHELNRAATAAVSAAGKKKSRVKTYEEMMANARARAAVNGKDEDQQLQHSDNNNLE
jgi:hypothetical protein